MLPFQTGNQLVAPELRESQWQPNYSPYTRHYNLHGCFLEGLGGCLRQDSDQREMVSHRETVTYKCSRTQRCYAGNTVYYEESTFEDNISEHGQLNRSGLRQSQGRHSLPRTPPGNASTLELVHSEPPLHNSIPCSRENQCGCRSRVERILGQQRLDVRPDNYPPLSEGLHHRSVRLATYPSTDDLRQLEARPPVSSFGCIQRELETPSGLRIPPVQFNCTI